VGVAKSDLHHLFPVMARNNSRRGNRPFCEVEVVRWSEEGSKSGDSRHGTSCFEPPDRHKGDLARAMLYFSIRYSKEIDLEQEEFFRLWSQSDQVSPQENERNDEIESIQDNRNPFVDLAFLVHLIDDF